MPIALALYQPDIAQNTGTLIRLCACMGVDLHIIHPTGFALSEKGLRRAGMDYVELARVIEHDSFAAFSAWRTKEERRLVLLTTKGAQSVYGAAYSDRDVLLLGRESAGVPDKVAAKADLKVRIPMQPDRRSLNVAIAGAMALGEALRQVGEMAEMMQTGPA